MAASNEIAQIEAINKGLTTLNTTLNTTATNYLTLVKTIADGNEAIKANVTSFDGLAKAQKQTADNSKQLDSLGKQLATSEKKLKETEDARLQTIIKNRLATQEATKAITNKVKANQAEEGSLVAMRIKLSELTAAYDKSTVRTKEAAKEINKLSKEIGKAEEATNRGQRSVGQYGKVWEGLKSVLPIFSIAAIGMGLKTLATNIISTRSEFEKYEAVLTNTLGSNKSAKKELAMLSEFAAKTPFQLTELTGAFVKLTNYGLKPSREEMRKYGDLAASVGKGFDQLAEAVADAVTGEFERLKEFGIKSKKEGELITFTFKEQATVVENSSAAIKEYFLSLGDLTGVAGSMAAIAETLGGRLSNIGDAWDRLLNKMGEGSNGVMVPALNGIQKDLDDWSKLFDIWADKRISKWEGFLASFSQVQMDKVWNKLEYERMLEDMRSVEQQESNLEGSAIDPKKIDELNKKNEALAVISKAKADKAAELAKEKRDKELKDVQEKEKDKAKAVEDGLKKQEDLILRGGIEKNAINEKLVKDETDLMDEALKDAISRDEKEFEKWYDLEEKKKDKAKDDAKKKEELEKETAEKIRDLQIEIASEAINGIFDLSSAKRDEELNALDAQREKELSNKNLTEEQKLRINEEYDKKAAAIKTKQAKADKLQALFNIALSTAQASMKSLAQVPLPLGLPLLIATIALGAVQAGLVLAKPIPKFKDGTKNAPDRGIFGEAGRELMFLRSGEVGLANKATYFEGSKFKGAQILSNPETEKMISMNDSIGGRQMTDERILNGLKGVERAIMNKPVAIFDKENRAIGHATSHSQTIYLNRLMRNN